MFWDRIPYWHVHPLIYCVTIFMKTNTKVLNSVLYPWGETGRERYYYNNWPRFLNDQDKAFYRELYGIDCDDCSRGIKVFFDNEGYLQIINCDNRVIREKIMKGMENWYLWAIGQAKSKECDGFDLFEFAIGCAEEIKPNIFQLKSKDKSVVIGLDLMKSIRNKCGTYYPRADLVDIDTGSKELDDVLQKLFYEHKLDVMSYLSRCEYLDEISSSKKHRFDNN